MPLARRAVLVVLALASAHAGAQATKPDTSAVALRGPIRQGEFVVRTVTLHHLSSAEAMRLLVPYSQTAGGGVYEVPNVRAVTIREMPRIYNEMMGVLEKYDREPATVLLNFQLVSAEQTNTRDPAVAGLDSLLRGVLKYPGYRLLNTSVATAGENQVMNQILSADGEPLSLEVYVSDLRVEGNDASVHLNVTLSRPAAGTNVNGGRGSISLLSTGVTVPIGQTVVLGTSSVTNGQPTTQRAFILTVRPQLAKR